MKPIVGYCPGVFDLFHVGHLNALRYAKAHCDYLIAGVVSDEKSLRTKGKTPVVPTAERIEIVQAIGYVDRAVVEDVEEKLDMWRALEFDVLFKGDDWRGTAKGDKLEADFAKVGVEVSYFPYTQATSSTLLRSALNALTGPSDVTAAAAALLDNRDSPASASHPSSPSTTESVVLLDPSVTPVEDQARPAH